MLFKSSIFFNPFSFLISQIRRIYLNSKIYNKKISKVYEGDLEYRPTLNLLDCIIKTKTRSLKVEELQIKEIWTKQNLNKKDYTKLHSFFWLFSIDLKSSKNITQSILLNWMKNFNEYNKNNWQIDILSKRIISWIANSQITYDGSSKDYKFLFSKTLKKQVNHLINEINNSANVDDKMLGCTAIILAGISFKDQGKYYEYGLDLLRKIVNNSFLVDGFPKSRNPRQLLFYLKYLILIREILKESYNEVPEYLNETIYYSGKSFEFFYNNTNDQFLFNGNHLTDLSSFNKFIKDHNYKFKSEGNTVGGYLILRNKKNSFIMDVGSPPEKKYSTEYQSGALSIEIVHEGEKLITNCGYYQDFKHKLNLISKSTATHSALCVDNRSSCNFRKLINGHSILDTGLKVYKKETVLNDDSWQISAQHDGYLKRYGVIYQRNIFFDLNKQEYIGTEKLKLKKNFQEVDYDIRFHLMPEVNAIQTQDKKSVLIQLKKSGWKFTCENKDFGVETGLYFGNKNIYSENQNIFINGSLSEGEIKIIWKLKKI